MIRLFSSFDVFLFKIPFISFYFVSTFIFFNFWLKNFFSFLLEIFSLVIFSFFKRVMNFKFKVIDFFLVALIVVIFFFNFLSILSYNFSFTSQISFNMYWGLRIWVGLILYSLFYNFKHVFIHFIPEGTPNFLIWFLFFVELVSNIIRPLTLVVRLLANILAGHLLIILLSKIVFIFFPFFIFYIFLNLVEFFVSLIQAYIFVTIIILYFSEIF